ncbi:MAG: SRPBCC domain-containing protein [Candidatus Acidiferrales bacterium]
MTQAIQQSVRFPVAPEVLFEMFMDSKKHSEATGAPARISRRSGGQFTAFGGQLRGKNLAVVSNKMIVQSWRGPWKVQDLDSILVITFEKVEGGTRVDLVHSNVPEHDHKGVSKGWPKYYWKPWKEYLKKKKK